MVDRAEQYVSNDLINRYERYVLAFNAGDFDALEEHLDPDVVFEWGGVMDDLIGRTAFFEFYRKAWTRFDERIDVRVLHADEESLVAWVRTELSVFRDWLDCPIEPLHAGEEHRVSGAIQYRFNAGRIVHIAEIDYNQEDQ